MPAAGDNGTAIGAAYYLYNCILKNKRGFVHLDPYVGIGLPLPRGRLDIGLVSSTGGTAGDLLRRVNSSGPCACGSETTLLQRARPLAFQSHSALLLCAHCFSNRSVDSKNLMNRSRSKSIAHNALGIHRHRELQRSLLNQPSRFLLT